MMGLIIACLLGLVLVLLLSATYWRGVLQQRNALIDTWIDAVREANGKIAEANGKIAEANGKIATRDRQIAQLVASFDAERSAHMRAANQLLDTEAYRDAAIRAERQMTEAYNTRNEELSWYRNLLNPQRTSGAPALGESLVCRRFTMAEIADLPPSPEPQPRKRRRKRTTLRAITRAGQ